MLVNASLANETWRLSRKEVMLVNLEIDRSSV